MEQRLIKTQRLLLRPLKAGDKPVINALAGNWNVAKTTLSIPHPYSIEMAEEWIEFTHTNFLNGAAATYAICDKNAGSLLGAITLIKSESGEATYELGYWVGEPYWNQGYATEAVGAMIKHAFKHLAANKITATHLDSNTASGKVMLKNQMQYMHDEEFSGRDNVPATRKLYQINAS